jgi:hypothetical protein
MTASLQRLSRKLLKITCISNTSFSMVVFSQQGQMTFYHGGHPEWYAALEQQLGLRLGQVFGDRQKDLPAK